MRFEVECELEELKRMLRENDMESDKANNFILDDEYEFEYSHGEIFDIRDEFSEEAERYLKENYKGQYVILNTHWCVHIVAIEFYKNKKLERGIVC